MKKYIPFLGLVLSLAAVQVASAATIGTDAVGAVNVSAPSVSVTASTNANTDVSSSISGSLSSGANASASNNASSSNSATADDNAASISVSPIDVSLNGDASTTPMAAASVSTGSDLKSYAMASMQNDSNIRGMAFSNDSVEVRYNEPGKFLGFIPVHVTAIADVNTDGTVSVRHPWYDFLTVKEDSNLKDQISADVGTAAQGSTSFNYATDARIADRVTSDMRADNTASASNSTSVSQ